MYLFAVFFFMCKCVLAEQIKDLAFLLFSFIISNGIIEVVFSGDGPTANSGYEEAVNRR